jgi:hypothetical protein
LFQRHFADTNDSRTPSGGAGGALAHLLTGGWGRHDCLRTPLTVG